MQHSRGNPIVLKSKTVTYFGHTAELVDDPRYNTFYGKLTSNQWEPDTFQVLARMLDGNTTYIDIGAWIGVTPLWASAKAKQVVAVEPDPYCIGALRFLMAKNACTNITLMEGALAFDRVVELSEKGGFGSSESSLLAGKGQHTVTVRGISVEDVLAQAGPGPKFCKVDIEGFEYEMMDQLVALAVPEMKAVQIAVHPKLLMRAKGWWPVVGRVRAAYATWRLVQKLRARNLGVTAKNLSPVFYILTDVILTYKVRGTDLLAYHLK
jgi:FkbM family methyltransferase